MKISLSDGKWHRDGKNGDDGRQFVGVENYSVFENERERKKPCNPGGMRVEKINIKINLLLMLR
jgi:hypothetical protein